MQASTVIVFGGSSGIGAAVVARLAGRGFGVVAVGRDASKVAAVASKAGATTRGLSVDANDRSAVDAMFRDIGTIDHVVVAHSGGRGAGPFASLALDDVRSGLEAKLLSHMNVAQASLPISAKVGPSLSSLRSPHEPLSRGRSGSPRSTARSKRWCIPSHASSRPRGLTAWPQA